MLFLFLLLFLLLILILLLTVAGARPRRAPASGSVLRPTERPAHRALLVELVEQRRGRRDVSPRLGQVEHPADLVVASRRDPEVVDPVLPEPAAPLTQVVHDGLGRAAALVDWCAYPGM